MATYQINELPWDTQYFDYNSLKIVLNKEINKKKLELLIDEASKYDFVTIINKGNNSQNNIRLKKLSPYLVDINVQLRKKIENESDLPESSDVKITNGFECNEKILSIAKESFVYSRFYNDPYLDKEKSKKLYYEWVKNSFNNEKKYFTKVYNGTDIEGFLLFSINDSNEGIIELIATNPSFQSSGLGSKLIVNSERFLRSRGISEIKVGTQVNNISAINFYFKNGYKMFEVNSVFHYWPKEGDIDE